MFLVLQKETRRLEAGRIIYFVLVVPKHHLRLNRV